MDKLYDIVKFIDEKDSVAVVPVKWVTNGICRWPCSYKPERLNRAIKKCEVPGDDWTDYDISIIYNSGKLFYINFYKFMFFSNFFISF